MAKIVYIMKEKEYARMQAFSMELANMLGVPNEFEEIINTVSGIQEQLSQLTNTRTPDDMYKSRLNFLLKMILPKLGLSEDTTYPTVIGARIDFLLQKA
jgi:hypothetical protein